MKYLQFSSWFWPPSVSSEAFPNYKTGIQVLHDKLLESVIENETIIQYLKKRIDTEKQCAELFISNLTPAMSIASDSVESTMNAGLKSSFDIVCQEHADIARGHRVRAGLLEQDVLSPIVQFTQNFKLQLEIKYNRLIEEVQEFEHSAQASLLTRSVYWSKCQALESEYPDFRPPLPPKFQEDTRSDEIEVEGLQDDSFIGDRQRSSSVTSELNVDRGGVRLGKYTVLPYREVARCVTRMTKMIESKKVGLTSSTRKYVGSDIFEWIRDYCVSPPPASILQQQQQQQQNETAAINIDAESYEVCKHLVALKFLKSVPKEKNGFDLNGHYQVQHNVVERYLRKVRIKQSTDDGSPEHGDINEDIQNTPLEVPSSNTTNKNSPNMLNGFFDRLNPLKKTIVDDSIKAELEMNNADQAYKSKVESANHKRKKLEENMFDYFDQLQELEIKRVETVKQAFNAMSVVLNDNSSVSNETYSRISLIQETLKPEQDIQYIIEQLKTAPFCPKSIIYENYYYGSAVNKIFGVPLEEIAQIYGSYIPPIITKGLGIIESAFNLTRENEMEKGINDIWINILPLKEIYTVYEKVDNLSGPKLQDELEHIGPTMLANLIRMYLLELPECILTFDLYDPVKILYSSSNDNQSRLISVSNLLATLPSPNYHTLKAFAQHMFKLLKNVNNENLINDLVSTYSYALLRPQVYSSLNMYDQHSKRLIRDIFTHYDIIFTNDINRAQESSASRFTIIADSTNSSVPQTTTSEKDDESALRSFFNILRRSSSESKRNSSSSDKSLPIVPPPTITLFEDPEYSEPKFKTSETSTSQSSTLAQEHDDDTVDMVRLSSELELILSLEGQEDAVEIKGKDDLEKKLMTPATPGRSRTSTRGTLDNIELDPFFAD